MAANANAAVAMDAPLAHVRQRLDALVYDDHSQYVLGSLQHADSLFLSPLTRQLSQRQPSQHQHQQQAMATTTAGTTPGGGAGRMSGALGVSILRRRIPGGGGPWARFVGITPYYVLFVLFIGLGWLFQAIGVFTFALAFQPMVRNDSVGHVQIETLHQSFVALSFFFLAEMAGAVGFGSCADHYGRRKVLLAAIAMWFVGEALVAAAWSYASLLAFRLVAGIGLGGQSALLITVSLEFSPKRTRGRILVLSQLLGGVGLVAATLLAKLLRPWRWIYVVLAIGSLAFVTVYVLFLRESPKYLASIGRIEQALVIIQGMESAHGIDRQARFTVPSSLYAPPALQQQQQRRRNSSQITDVRPLAGSPTQLVFQLNEDEELDSGDDLAPLPLPATRRLTHETNYNNRTSYMVPSSGNVGRPRASTDRHAAASPAMVSFTVSSSKRFGVLFQSHYLRKTVFLWTVWLVLCGAFGAAITCTARRLELVEIASAAEYAFIGLMTLPGLVLSAVLVERLGRKVALAALVFCASILMFIAGGYMAKGASRTALLATLGCLGSFLAGAFAALCVYTGEHYALMVRAMGIAWALACGHLGSFIGVFAVLTTWIWTPTDSTRTDHVGHAGHQLVLYVSGGLGLTLLFIVLGFGDETQGLDIDVIEPLKPERELAPRADEDADADNHIVHGHEDGDPDDKHNQRHHRTFERHVAVHEQLSTVPSSPGASFSSASSSSASSSSNFFRNSHKKTKNWKKQMRAFAAAAAAAVPLRKSTTTAATLRKKSTRSTLQLDDGDLDQLDGIVTDGEAKTAQYLRHHASQPQYHHQPNRHRSTTDSGAILLDFPQTRKRTDRSDASEPALMDWRPSDTPSSEDEHDHHHHGHSGLHDHDGHGMLDGDNRSDSEADKFSIDHGYDSFHSLSTPMLEGSPVLGFER